MIRQFTYFVIKAIQDTGDVYDERLRVRAPFSQVDFWSLDIRLIYGLDLPSHSYRRNDLFLSSC